MLRNHIILLYISYNGLWVELVVSVLDTDPSGQQPGNITSMMSNMNMGGNTSGNIGGNTSGNMGDNISTGQ